MRIINLNPDENIGASAWLAEMDNHRLLLDAGTHPKREGRDGLPLYRQIADLDVDAIALSHCHHDHVGSLPVALQHFPSAHVLMTELSYFLVERILHNSVNVMQRQRDERGIRDYPLYTHEEVDDYASVFQGFKYGRPVEWAAVPRRRGSPAGPTLEFHDAGHTLGSAGILVRGAAQTLFYTGDVCFHDQTILRRANFDEVQADVLVMETTRGDRELPRGFTREREVERFTEALLNVLKRRGSVLIPAFALGRTQELLALLALLMADGRLRRQPVYIGGLGRVFTEIYDLEAHRANRQHTTLRLTQALDLQVLSPGQLQDMKLSGGRIFVLTSGMMSENTAAHDLAVRLAHDERNAIFFVGYADPDTPGGRLKAAAKGKPFLFSASAGELTRRCQVEDFDLTAHANRQDLLQFATEMKPKAIVLGHGDVAARAWFAQQLKQRLPRTKVYQPGPGETVEI
jgi:Cft2 family RNA processing exonuclease